MSVLSQSTKVPSDFDKYWYHLSLQPFSCLVFRFPKVWMRSPRLFLVYYLGQYFVIAGLFVKSDLVKTRDFTSHLISLPPLSVLLIHVADLCGYRCSNVLAQ